MIVKPRRLVTTILNKLSKIKGGSTAVTDRRIIKDYTENPDFPFLVSFPRTGSHWLRMLMELYFERPSLVRIFYFPERKDYLCLHTHDLNLDVFRKNVIYLYRDPIPTIYSQMKYENENLNDISRIKYWTELYKRHLKKWLIEETVSEKKTIIRYECLKQDLSMEFKKIADFFGEGFDRDKVLSVAERISKVEVKNKTIHDKKVVNLAPTYARGRQIFFDKYGSYITGHLFSEEPVLENFFRPMSSNI